MHIYIYIYILTLQYKTLQALQDVVHTHVCRCMHKSNSCWNLVAISGIPIYMGVWDHKCGSVTFAGPKGPMYIGISELIATKRTPVITSRIRFN